MVSSRPALANEATPDLVYNILQQGMGRIWAPEAVFGDFPAEGAANAGMDIADLDHEADHHQPQQNGRQRQEGHAWQERLRADITTLLHSWCLALSSYPIQTARTKANLPAPHTPGNGEDASLHYP